MEKLKILVVDDESRMRKLVRDFLVKRDLKYWKPETEKKHWIFFIQIIRSHLSF